MSEIRLDILLEHLPARTCNFNSGHGCFFELGDIFLNLAKTKACDKTPTRLLGTGKFDHCTGYI